ncbi:anti-virulence regulator CigR family protein [Pseudomonas aeruginosa]
MLKFRTLLAALVSVFLASATPLLLADPGGGKGNKHDKGAHQGNQGHKSHSSGSGWQGSPDIDIGGVRIILNDNRAYWSPGSSLPPGIQKNLARGKPLPPGIAKKLDSRLLGRLPHYEGYEWQQVGTDLLLVTIATGVIYEVLSGVLD